MSDYISEIIERHVQQFNQQVNSATACHKHMLKRLCVERMRATSKGAYDAPARIQTVESKRLAILNSTLHQAHRVGELGRRTIRRIIPMCWRTRQRATDQPLVIEGEYVISDESSELSKKSTVSIKN